MEDLNDEIMEPERNEKDKETVKYVFQRFNFPTLRFSKKENNLNISTNT